MREVYSGTFEDVVCDMCGEDFTNRDDEGGFTLGSKAVCPLCVPKVMKDLKGYNEESHIRARCPEGKSFRAWVREDLRGGKPGEIRVIEF